MLVWVDSDHLRVAQVEGGGVLYLIACDDAVGRAGGVPCYCQRVTCTHYDLHITS